MIEAALSHVPNHDRDTWVTMAMAIKSELGEGGFDIWNAWSASDPSYKERDAKAVWRSVKASGGITIASLYKMARDNGYRGEEIAPRPRPVADLERERLAKLKEDRKREQAALNADIMIRSAEFSPHPYLASKGFPEAHGLVLDEELLIPMRDFQTNQITSVQRISADGGKKFLTGGRAKGAVYVIGAGSESYLCEGYATGLSVQAALKALYRQARVVVCFSASNMAHVARIGTFVVADHDASQTGEKFAVKTGLPWWMPPELGDANDYMQRHGVRALAKELNELRRGLGRGSVAPGYASGNSG